MLKIYSFFIFLLLLSACQYAAPKESSSAPAFVSTPYWITSSFINAVAAESDTLGASNCMELHFTSTDSVMVVTCEVEAMLCAYKVIDDKTIEITSGFGDALKPRITQISDSEVELSGMIEGEKFSFEPIENHEHEDKGLSVLYLAQQLAGTYQPQNPFGRTGGSNPVELSATGKVKGFGAYKSFQTAIGGDLAASEAGNMIYFDAAKEELVCAWSKRGDTLTLIKLNNVSAPDEKPWYEGERVYDIWIKKH